MEIEECIKDFLNYCIFEKGLSDKTKLSYKNDLEIYKEFLNKRKIYNVENIKIIIWFSNINIHYLRNITNI